MTTTTVGGSPASSQGPMGSPIENVGIAIGQSCTNSGGSTPSDILYRSQRKDSSTGTYQLGTRTYDPSKAAFLTPDVYRNGPSNSDLAVGTDPLTRDSYSYVNGDPVNLNDPTGHDPCGAPGGGGCCLRSNDSSQFSLYDLRHHPSATAWGLESLSLAKRSGSVGPAWFHQACSEDEDRIRAPASGLIIQESATNHGSGARTPDPGTVVFSRSICSSRPKTSPAPSGSARETAV